MHDTIGGRHVFLKDTYVVNGSVESGSMICYIGSDNDYGATRNVCQILLSKIKCNAGYWNFQYQQQYAFYSDFNEMINFMCNAVEPGYYSPEGALTRTACPDGETTTGYGVGADEINDCGYDLVLGDSKLHLRRAQRTNPSLQVLHNGKVYYGDATPANNKGKLRILYNNTIYSVYDDTM